MKKDLLEQILNNGKNVIVSGNIRSGKTTNIMFPLVSEMINKKESLFFLDSKEEYLNTYYQELKNKNYNIIILNIRNLDNSESWNPLLYPYKLFKENNLDKAKEYLEKIGKTLFYEESTSSDPFWTNMASDFITGIILGLFADAREDEINFISVNNMINEEDSGYLREYFNLKDKNALENIYSLPTISAPIDTKGGILATARSGLKTYISSKKLSEKMQITSFDYKDILNKQTAIFFIGKDENKAYNSLIAIFIEQLYNYLLDEKNKRNFNFVLDNFDSLIRVDSISDMMSSCLARNIKILIGTRSIGALKEKYGSYITELADVIEIKNKDILLNINGEYLKETKDFKDVSIKEQNIKMPNLKEKKVNTFDLRLFIKNKKKELKI